MPGSVASVTRCIFCLYFDCCTVSLFRLRAPLLFGSESQTLYQYSVLLLNNLFTSRLILSCVLSSHYISYTNRQKYE